MVVKKKKSIRKGKGKGKRSIKARGLSNTVSNTINTVCLQILH